MGMSSSMPPWGAVSCFHPNMPCQKHIPMKAEHDGVSWHSFAKPVSPFCIQKHKPPICPKFVTLIVSGGSSEGVQNWQNCVKIGSENYPLFFGQMLANVSQ